MDKDFMLNYFNKAVQPEWEELLKTPRYQPAASKRDAIEREFFRMLNDEQKRQTSPAIYSSDKPHPRTSGYGRREKSIVQSCG